MAHSLGLRFINGIEFSTRHGERGIHVVGLNVDVQHTLLNDTVAQQRQLRMTRARAIAERLERLGIVNAFEGAAQFAGGEVVGRPHFARLLIARGVVPDMNSAFRHYLSGRLLDGIDENWLDLPTVIAAIREAGGQAVLAHPLKYDLSRTNLFALIRHFKTLGGEAIEVLSGHQSAKDTENLSLIAKQLNLHASCGSDFHVPDQPWQELGACGLLPKSCQPVWQLWQ